MDPVLFPQIRIVQHRICIKIDHGGNECHRIEAVHYPAVSGYQLAEILYAVSSLDPRCNQITCLPGKRAEQTDKHKYPRFPEFCMPGPLKH